LQQDRLLFFARTLTNISWQTDQINKPFSFSTVDRCLSFSSLFWLVREFFLAKPSEFRGASSVFFSILFLVVFNWAASLRAVVVVPTGTS
jgi:hypothetical protein